ncbi:MAG: thioredoxin family protein [Bacteroidia bacterium]|nr:thioredoxin family protein [Bacteroidia bacterium]MDW8345439.1 thioredoxin family protein [Bacteroidia bacterium]
MKNLSKLSIAVFLITLLWKDVCAQEAGVQFFKGTWDELVAKAKSEKKPFFVDVYAVWCGPCKWMSKNTFTNPQVSEYANKNFIAYKIDGEKGEGPKIVQQYKVEAYPTILFFSPEGQLVGSQVGAQEPESFIATMKKFKDKR